MPSKSKKQHNFMAAVAKNPSFAKKAGVPQSVGKEFLTADKGKTFKEGGTMATKMNPGFMAMIAKKKAGAKSEMPSKMGKPVMKKGMDTAKDGMKMAKGGMHKMPDGKMMKDSAMKKMNMGGMGYAKGGGIESKGKTEGKMVKMNKGGKAC